MELSFCPYCRGELPPPTRKRECPHCKKTIFARTRPGRPQAWVRQEDLLPISKEWADEMPRRDIEAQKRTGVELLELARHNIREWVKCGVVKSLKLWNMPEGACDVCKQMDEKSFPIKTKEQISFVMENANVKACENSVGCRCYWRPDEVSID